MRKRSKKSSVSAKPSQDTQTPDRKPYDPETDPLIVEARERLKSDFITQLCGEGSTQPSGVYGPAVSHHGKRGVVPHYHATSQRRSEQ